VHNQSSNCAIFFIYLAVEMQKCLPYSQNAFNSVHVYKTASSFSDDKLGAFLSSTCVNPISYVTSQELVLSQSLKVSYHYTHSYSCGPVDLDYNTCSQVNEYKCWREHSTSVYYENSGKTCLQNSTKLEDYKVCPESNASDSRKFFKLKICLHTLNILQNNTLEHQ